ncbi:hypothetical protein [Paenibacillus sp. y28]|uniref:hypothetical protein n=1 Tax=Paenibacillus sp. y28 TaxID=3129110 RepID=UPI003019B68C
MAAVLWEYYIGTNRSELASLGEEGWELVSVAVWNGEETFYMKRPAPTLREQITLSQRDHVLVQQKEAQS